MITNHLVQTAQEIQEIFEINYVTPVELILTYLTQMLVTKRNHYQYVYCIKSVRRWWSRLYVVWATPSVITAVGSRLC